MLIWADQMEKGAIYIRHGIFGARVFPCQWNNRVNLSAFPKSPVSSSSTEALRESSGSLLSLLKAKLPALIRLLEHVLAGFRVVPRKFQIETKVKDKFHISKSHPQSHFKRSFSNFPWLAMKFEGCKL